MDCRLNLGTWRKVFAVPVCVAEDHLKTASGIQLKVLLYLLAYPDLGHRIENIASAVGIAAEDAEDALLYWENTGVICREDSEYYTAPAEKTAARPPENKAVFPAPSDDTLNTPEARAALKSEMQFPPKVIAGAVNGSKGVEYLFRKYEELLGRTLRHTEKQLLMVLVEEVGLPCEVTLLLLEYCFSIDKGKPAYMKAVALDWVENDITDIAKAEQRISVLRESHDFEYTLRQKFGITQSFSASQKKIIEEWASLGLPMPLIDEAYDRMLTNTGGKLSFPYMDKLLKSWNADGITEPSQLKKSSSGSRNSGSGGGAGGDAPSYDISEAEKSDYDQYKDL